MHVQIELDALDRSILNVLQDDGRMSNVDLAIRVGLSASACLRRIRSLEDRGVISGYVALVNPEAIGRPTAVFVEISLNGQAEELLDRFEAEVAQVAEVRSCHLMAGDADYLVHVECADVADYERIHRSHLAMLPGVSRLRSSFAIRTVAQSTSYEL